MVMVDKRLAHGTLLDMHRLECGLARRLAVGRLSKG